MNTHIVLGLGFGDEGKGITTDYLCHRSVNPIVVRFSGGQQAGHTVVIDGVKHVHASFGSGSLRGKPSFFTEHCTIYLPNLINEYNALVTKTIKPRLFVHPLAMLTTPFDVAYNRITCEGGSSVGLGINATMQRHNAGYKIHAMDLMYPDILFAKIEECREYYLAKFEAHSPEKSLFIGEYLQYLHIFYEQIFHFQNYFRIEDYNKLWEYSDVIFEGSQGIMLDMDHGIFPDVTHAYTTSRNAIELIRKNGFSTPNMYYVTRCYQTRHGNGWMSNTKEIELTNNEHEINVENKFQGKFKVAEIDYRLLLHAYAVDRNYSAHTTYPKSVNLVVTCLDQRPDFVLDEKFAGMFDSVITSTSPESKNMTIYDKARKEIA